MARTEECLTCGRVFPVPPMHPMVEPAWCSECLVILSWVWAESWESRHRPALRAEDV